MRQPMAPQPDGGGRFGAPRARSRFLALCLVVAITAPGTVEAQSIRGSVRAQAVVSLTRVDPIPEGGRLTELRVVQPVLMFGARAWQNRLLGTLTLNGEGGTIPNGELTPGIWGEGFVDRRHPHTYVHELMLAFVDPLGTAEQYGFGVGVAAGKGFVPFGTDDPMGRPILRYPVNHHLAQILERAVLIGQLRLGTLVFEAAAFNGDEPERPGQWPLIGGRFGDSWSIRAVVTPTEWLELQGSRATVHSPEHRAGAGLDVEKWSASARMDGAVGGVGHGYALVEWAQSEELQGILSLDSYLAEGAMERGRGRLSYRYERTDRPEEERLLTPFRTRRPHLDDTVLGASRWTIHTVGLAVTLRPGPQSLGLMPFAEVSTGTVAKLGGGVFEPDQIYAKDRFWSVSVGVRLDWNLASHRMGRYGLLAREHHGF